MSLVSGPGRGGGAHSRGSPELYTKQHVDYIVSLNTVCVCIQPLTNGMLCLHESCS